MLEGKPLRAALEEITAAAYHGILFRCVSLRSLLGLVTDPAGHVVITRPNPHFLFDRGPVRDGGRFTPIGGEPSLYMAETENTARLEKRQGAAFRTVRQEGHGIEVAYALEATLTNVLDLTSLDVADRLETSRDEIIEAWRFRPDDRTPPTHILGAAVVKSKRFSAIRYPSATNPRGRCIVAFSALVRDGETIALVDEDGIFRQIMRLASS
jgi:RES domain-containing protein